MTNKGVILLDLDHTLYNVDKQILYDDALPFIEFAESKGDLFLFTEGEIKTQNEKIDRLGLNKYFKDNKILVFDSYSKMVNVAGMFKDSNIIVIDDNPEVIKKANELGWTTIRIRRGRYEDQKVDSDYEVKSLRPEEFINIFK